MGGEAMSCQESQSFKCQMDVAIDWSHQRGIPVSIERDRNFFWFVYATLKDPHGTFYATVAISNGRLDMSGALDRAVSQMRSERHTAFYGKTPGHLPVHT